MLGIMFYVFSAFAFFLPKISHHIIYKIGYFLFKSSPEAKIVIEEESFRHYIKYRFWYTILAYLFLLPEFIMNVFRVMG
ncbi:MAG: hypothetical protein E7603_05665 [Ruminococcaceae bacterium]|nr:hypothetical protein [Oscillospiraceae bacterium]